MVSRTQVPCCHDNAPLQVILRICSGWSRLWQFLAEIFTEHEYFLLAQGKLWHIAPCLVPQVQEHVVGVVKVFLQEFISEVFVVPIVDITIPLECACVRACSRTHFKTHIGAVITIVFVPHVFELFCCRGHGGLQGLILGKLWSCSSLSSFHSYCGFLVLSGRIGHRTAE